MARAAETTEIGWYARLFNATYTLIVHGQVKGWVNCYPAFSTRKGWTWGYGIETKGFAKTEAEAKAALLSWLGLGDTVDMSPRSSS